MRKPPALGLNGFENVRMARSPVLVTVPESSLTKSTVSLTAIVT